jgi:hypothetical protein
MFFEEKRDITQIIDGMFLEEKHFQFGIKYSEQCQSEILSHKS